MGGGLLLPGNCVCIEPVFVSVRVRCDALG